MPQLTGKRALIIGVANHRSIAWGIAKALRDEGCALAFTCLEPTERWVQPLAESVSAAFVARCDVSDDAALDALFARVDETWGGLDIVVHAVAFAPLEALAGTFVDTRRDDFRAALDVSVYSLVALAQRAAPRMRDGGAIVTMTYHGSQQVMPHYNVMGVAKAALECSVRYLAADLGPRGVRVNAISAGPLRTLATSAFGGFRRLLDTTKAHAPMRRNVTLEDVGATAAFLCSDGASGITGEVLYVDCGLRLLGAPPEDDLPHGG